MSLSMSLSMADVLAEFSRNYGRLKTWLVKCLKNPVWEDPSRETWETGLNTVEISITSPLPYLLISAKATESEKISLNDMQNLTTVS